MSHAVQRRLVVTPTYAGWRKQALIALAAQWPPETLAWEDAPHQPQAAQIALDYAAPGDEPHAEAPCPGVPPAPPQVRVSREFAQLLREAAQYRSPRPWALLYRVLWRYTHGDRAGVSAADEDGARLHAMAKAVRRDHHDMIAYVRFRRSDRPGMPEYVAWYEPRHDVLADAADHFARRMGHATWCIGTPHGLAHWDGSALRITDAPADAQALRADAAADPAEALWRLYYQSTFNPARLNEAALHQRMPVRFWKGLPEAALIPSMIAQARHGARRHAQAQGVGDMPGKPVAVDAQRARPQRPVPAALDACRRCELWRHATQAVPGQGRDAARVMLVGEQPGDHEDLAGQVFIGPAGQVLDEALKCAGVPRDALYLTNAVKHFKWVARGKRRIHKTPAQREIDACSHWLQEELERVRPEVIVALGATALRAIAGPGARLQECMGRPMRLGRAWLLATWHPSYALRAGGDDARGRVVAGIADAVAQGYQLAGSASENAGT